MDNGYIAVLDSGIGGFSVLCELIKVLPHERFLYFGDNKNAPYGSKTKGELYYLARKNLSYILSYNVKAVVFGCNTLTMVVLPLIAPACRAPTFGVYPPNVKPRGTTYLFATPMTCAKIKERENLRVFPLKNLAADIERNKYRLESVDLDSHLTQAKVPTAKADTVILGCTHYFFVKNQFIDHFCPRKILSGEKSTAVKLKNYLNKNDLIRKSENFTVDFIGENSEENFIFYNSVVKDMIFGKEKN